ncbi:MAG TPA: HEAT repeat domain-containing protein [Thermoguttaceae bacterium]|nr:HEAT repeat domain-containing protein [Thermoguttaceae bacterium]
MRDPQTVSDFGSELRAALYALEEIGDRRALPAISALVKYDNKPRRMQSALEDILAKGSDQQLWVDIRSDDPNIADGAQRILDSPEQYGRAERREPRESEADAIVVGRAAERGEKGTTVEVLKTLKGSLVADFYRISDSHFGQRLPIDQMQRKRWICYLHVNDRDLLPEPVLRSEWYIPWTEKTESDVLASIPLPTRWGPLSGSAQMGLRLRAEEVPAGADVPVEIAIRNTGEKPIELHQHRFNIYDYYSRTQFAVTDGKGRRTLLAKPVGRMKESGRALTKSLAPGEVYIHTVRLNRWPVAPEELDRQNARNPLGSPGTYTIECTYTAPPNTSWRLTLTTAPVKVTITAPEKLADLPGDALRSNAAVLGNERADDARLSVVPPEQLPLCGSRLSIEEAVKQEFAFVVACEALEDTQGQIGAIGKLNCTQEFQVHQLLAGDGPGVDTFRLHYTYVDRQDCRERAVRKRDRVIWIVRKADEGQWIGVKAVPDTPENRKAVQESLATQPAGDAATARAKSLADNVDKFVLLLWYAAPAENVWHALRLRVPDPPESAPENEIAVRIGEGQARKIIAYLAKTGFLARARNISGKLIGFSPPGCVLQVFGAEESLPDGRKYPLLLAEKCDWNLKMLGMLDGLRNVLDGQAAKEMDEVLGNLQPHRKAWEKAAATLTQAEADRAARLVKSLKANKAGFVLSVEYRAPQADIKSPERGDHSLTFTVAPPPEPTVVGQYIQITEAQADRIIDHLAVEQVFLGRANDVMGKLIGGGPRPGCTWLVWGASEPSEPDPNKLHPMLLRQGTPASPEMLARLDGLRKVLDDDAAKAMDELLKRLEPHRKEWEKAASSATPPTGLNLDAAVKLLTEKVGEKWEKRDDPHFGLILQCHREKGAYGGSYLVMQLLVEEAAKALVKHPYDFDVAVRIVGSNKRWTVIEAAEVPDPKSGAGIVKALKLTAASPPDTQPADGTTQPVGDAGAARASVATLLAEAETLRKESAGQWAQWDKAVADVLAKHAAMVKDWGWHTRPPAPDVAPLKLPMAYLVWHWRDASTAQRLPAAYGLGEMYLRAIADSGDKRRIDILLQVLGGSEWGGKLLVKAMTPERAEPSIRELLAGSPKLARDAPLHMLLRELAAGLSPAVRKAGYDWLRAAWLAGPSNGDGEQYWETLFRLDPDRARREVIPYYGQRYNRTDRYDLYVLRLLLAHAGPCEEVAKAVREWRKTPDELLDFYCRRVLVCADPEGELEGYVADIEAQFKSGQRPDELPYLVRTLVEHIPRQSVKYLRRFANDRRLTGLMGEGTRKQIVGWLVGQQDEQAEKIVARWLAEEDQYAQRHLIDILARQGEFARGLLKKARPGIELPPLPLEKAPAPATQPDVAGALLARIVLPAKVTPTNGLFPAKLEITNIGKQPVRVVTLCQAWRSSSKGVFHVSFQQDQWKSDPPSVEQSAKSVVELSPGESTTLPFEVVDGGRKTLRVTASYAVSEEFAKELNVWSGSFAFQPARVNLERVEEGELKILLEEPGEFPLFHRGKAILREKVSQLIEKLESPDPQSRLQAIYGLAKFGSNAKEAVPALVRRLKDEDAQVRIEAANSFYKIFPPTVNMYEVFPVWRFTGGPATPELMSPEEKVEFARVTAIANEEKAKAAKVAVPALIEALTDESVYMRQFAAMSLGAFGPHARDAVRPLIGLLEDESEAVRMWAVGALGGIGPDAKEAVPKLIAYFKKYQQDRLRTPAIRSLGKIGSGAKEAVPFLIELLQNRGESRYRVAEALGGIGPEAKAAVPALIAALEDPERLVRAYAAEALGKIAADTELIVPALMNAEKDEDFLVRDYASRALDSLIKLLGKQLNSRDWNEEAAAIRSTNALIEECPKAELHKLSPLVEPLFSKVGWGGIARDQANQAAELIARIGGPAVPFLVEKFQSPESHDRWCAIEILGRIGEPDAPVISVVRPMLHDKDAYVRRVAIDTLAALGSRARPAVEDLEKVLTDSTPNNRIRGHAALIRITGEAGGHIEAIAEHLKSHDMREFEASFAAATLGGFGAAARPVESHLRAALKHPHAQVRVDAAAALGAIGAESEETIVALIGQLREDRELEARRSSASALGKIGPAAKAAVPALSEVLESEDVDKSLRQAAAEAIKKIRQPAAPPDAKSANEPQRQPTPEEQVRPMFSGRVMAYYGNDADKARQNPDNVWTGSLLSNTVTVEIVAGENPEHALLPGSHLTLKEACGEKFEHAALWVALNEPNSSDHQRSEAEKKAGVFHFGQEYRLVDPITGKREPRLDLPSPYRCDRGAGERPIQKGERVIWIFQRPEGNDSATADAAPFDQNTRKWKQVTGLWTGTARSGTIKLNAAEAQQKSISSEQPSPIRAFRGVVAQEHFELKPISGLAPEKIERLQDLARRFHEQERNARSLPDTAKIIVLEEELGKFLSVSDLVAVTDCQYPRLSSTAFHLLRGTSNATLSQQDVAKLLEHLPDRETTLAVKGLLAAQVLAENERFGAPALAGVLRRSSDPLSRVHAAAGLAAEDSKADAASRREAESLLLASLGNDDDTARIAHNALPTLKPWMIEWLLERLGDPGASTAFWNNATSRLSTCNPKGFEKRLKQLFVDAESHASVNVRMNATNGLRALGLTKADTQLYEQILKDENPHVRRMLYAGLFQLKEPWTAPLLTAGLEDRLPENVGICADALAALDHKPAVPNLIATLRRDDLDANSPTLEAYRRVGQATVTLADLEGYDFHIVGRPVGSMYAHAMVIENRDEVYRKECTRLLNWWKTTGSGLKWDQ